MYNLMPTEVPEAVGHKEADNSTSHYPQPDRVRHDRGIKTSVLPPDTPHKKKIKEYTF
jgi:hypothetical protein